MTAELLVKELQNTAKFFERSIGQLEEQDSGFVPVPGMYNVAQQIAHSAFTVDWFMDGAFGGKGFDMDFAQHDEYAKSVLSIATAREHFASAIARAIEVISSKSEQELNELFPSDDPIMPGSPKLAVVGGIVDHTSHHRGALSVYTRLLGKVPPMPYM